MQRRTCKTILNISLLVVMIIFAIHPLEIHAKGNAIVKKVTMYPNMVKRVSSAELIGDVEWKTSDVQIISILSTKDGSAIFKSGNKTGSCTVIAKTEDIVYKYKITVKSDKKISRATLVSVKQTKNKIKIRVRIHNRSKTSQFYGKSYYYEKYVNGKWKKVKPNIEMGFTSEAILLPAKKSITKTYTISSDKEKSHYLKDDFTQGTYRIHVGTTYKKAAYNYVIFTIK